jgi:hypothetical protein
LIAMMTPGPEPDMAWVLICCPDGVMLGMTIWIVPLPSPPLVPKATTGVPSWRRPHAVEKTAGTRAPVPVCDQVRTVLLWMFPWPLMSMTKPMLPLLTTPMDSRPEPDGSKASAVGGVCEPSPAPMPKKVSVSLREPGPMSP